MLNEPWQEQLKAGVSLDQIQAEHFNDDQHLSQEVLVQMHKQDIGWYQGRTDEELTSALSDQLSLATTQENQWGKVPSGTNWKIAVLKELIEERGLTV